MTLYRLANPGISQLPSNMSDTSFGIIGFLYWCKLLVFFGLLHSLKLAWQWNMDPPEDVFVPKIRGFSSQSCYFSDFEGVFDICAIIVCLFLMSPSHSRPIWLGDMAAMHQEKLMRDWNCPILLLLWQKLKLILFEKGLLTISSSSLIQKLWLFEWGIMLLTSK